MCEFCGREAIEELLNYAKRSRVGVIPIFEKYFEYRKNSNPMHSLDMTIRYYNLNGRHFEESIKLTQ